MTSQRLILSCLEKASWSLATRHLRRRLNEQSHPELRHKIQCERCFSPGGCGPGRGPNRKQLGELREFLLASCLKSKTLFRKERSDEVDFKGPDPTAAEKHRLRIIIIIIVVIIIILWYNKDIDPRHAQRGVQWFAVAMVQWSPLGLAVGWTRVSVGQPSVRSLQGWEGLSAGGGAVSSDWFLGDQGNSGS